MTTKGSVELSPKLTDSKKEERRLQILNAAKKVFAAKGYGAATLKDIIEETDMSRGWIYLYFQTKDEIFEALLDNQDAEHERHLAELIESKSSIWEVVAVLYIQQLQELCRSPNGGLIPAFYEYFLIGWREKSRRELLLKRYENGIARFSELLQIGVERGEFSPIMDIVDIARLAASYQEGIMTHSITIGIEKANARMQFEALFEYLKTLLRPVSDYKPSRREEIE
ncbi:TetR family transcriptional regulator [Paenibacillus sp. PL91]|uniref:TetR family transcriptional regulator n=1 Tax=Paenibacillus sp. PL91 TaxID=2729538 RepID=UPI00145D2730|nr:TetR family transcriptional regulator [Paenibacillus sp. PL91]MBC9205112.1 TetR family transcriptional regulator [Paenibacillus sp. PL91]